MNFTQVGTILQLLFARLRFVAVFVVAALVVGYWDNITNHIDKWTRPASAPDSLHDVTHSDIEFYCPMHPDVIRTEAGSCPKCGMPLVKRKRGEAVRLPANVLARVQLTPQRVALGNIQTTLVTPRNLTREIRAVGILLYDETKLARVSARVAGRADELWVTYVGQSIARGDPIYSLYSPEVYTAQREYLAARKRVNELPKDAPEQTKSDASAVYNASLQKLALWGLSTEQLDRLDQEFDETGRVPTNLTVTSPISGIVIKKEITQGQYVQVGDAPYTVADLKRLWLIVKLFEQDIALVNIGDRVDLNVESIAQPVTGAVAFKAFVLDPETRTLDARVVVENADLKIRPGMFANVTIRVPVVPTTNPTATVPTVSNVDDLANAVGEALKPYLEAQRLLASDKVDGVADLLKVSASTLSSSGLFATAKAAKGNSIGEMRDAFRDFSNTLIAIAKQSGIPAAAGDVKIFRCPMKKTLWLQRGDATANPYYGAEMLTCGTAVESLPHATASDVTPMTHPITSPAGMVLAIPRSAVIDTGAKRIVYVASQPGAYDMREVKLGPIAGDFYPVLDGLQNGESVVTVGTFLVDAENRLNPTRIVQ
jgi:multidrug efflux pump subunit AcrA (membrane-fusion protein)